MYLNGPSLIDITEASLQQLKVYLIDDVCQQNMSKDSYQNLFVLRTQ